MSYIWKSFGGGRYVLGEENFYISYNPAPCSGIPMFGPDTPMGETALVKGRDFWILNGDWRKQYEEVVDKGFDACMGVYSENKKEHASSWSKA